MPSHRSKPAALAGDAPVQTSIISLPSTTATLASGSGLSSEPLSSAASSESGLTATATAAAPAVQTASISRGGSTFQTDEGTIRVQPYHPKGSKGLKALVSFQPRTSAFDLGNPLNAQDPFRGFYTLFWIGLFLLFARTVIDHYSRTGNALSASFFHLITSDALALALSDAVLVGASFGALAFAHGMRKGWWAYGWPVMAVQHVLQTAYLMTTVVWTFNRNWYWVQSGFLVLHSMSMLMKIHSYIAHNGHLCTIDLARRAAELELDRLLTLHPGGPEAAYAEARVIQRETEAAQRQLERDEDARAGFLGTGSSGVSTPGSEVLAGVGGAEAHLPKATLSESALRQRLTAVSKLAAAAPPPQTSSSPSSALASSKLAPAPSPAAAHPLVFHPSHDLSTLARNLDAYGAELTSAGPQRSTWPANVTAANFCDYLLVPTLVYELEWPRTTKTRPLYVFEKVCATMGTFMLIYIITEHYIMPVLPKEGDSFVVSFINLALPMLIDYLLIFFIMYVPMLLVQMYPAHADFPTSPSAASAECICNGFAELTCFADRRFFDPWWNSTSWDQFAREWNRPVHTFLLRHVYTSSLSTGKVSRNQATFLTFLLSAACHELVMIVVSKKLRLYLFVLQMIQIPLIALGRVPLIKRNKLAGNVVFWLGLLSGFPLLAIGYLMY